MYVMDYILGLRRLTARIVMGHGVLRLVHRQSAALQALLTGAVTLEQLVVKDVVCHEWHARFVLL